MSLATAGDARWFNRTMRRYDDVRYRHPDWAAKFADALARQPDEPRVEVTQADFPAYENWLEELGWYVFDRGVHPWGNSFSVVARRLEAAAPWPTPDDITEDVA